jgi:hypothetical protein
MTIKTASPGVESEEPGPIQGLISFLNMRAIASVKLPQAETQERTSRSSTEFEECLTT